MLCQRLPQCSLATWVLSRGAACSNSRPPLPRPPKVFEPVFLQIEILGESVGAKGAEIFFGLLTGYFFFTLRVYAQNTQNLVENSQMGGKHRKKFDPRPDLRVGPWLMGA